jgi:beta-glucosidase
MLEPTPYQARVANRGDAPATITLRLDDPLHGELVSTLQVPPVDDLISIAGDLQLDSTYTPTGADGTAVPAWSAAQSQGSGHIRTVEPHTLYIVFSAADVVLESLTV